MTTSQLQRINELSKSIEVRKKEEENEILNEYFKIYKNYKDAPFNEIKIYKFYQTKKIPLLTKIIPVLVLFSFFRIANILHWLAFRYLYFFCLFL